MKIRTFVAACVLSSVAAGFATWLGAVPVNPGPPTPAQQGSGRPFSGAIDLEVTATDTDHHIFAVHETVPVQEAGPTTLLYPEWEIGSHAPTASVSELAGLIIRIDGRRVDWLRDRVNVHAFHIDVPQGARKIVADFQFLSPPSAALLRPDMVAVQWHRVLLYPAGWNVRDLPVTAHLELPPGLRTFAALDVDRVTGNTVTFRETSIGTLADSPAYAARYWRKMDLSADGTAVSLDMIADAPSDLQISPDQAMPMHALVTQAAAVFGPPPFRHYDAIVTLSDALSPGGGIEHLQEGENFLPAAYFTDHAHQLSNRDLIAHEYAHAWNGRFRQPADFVTPGFNSPVGGSLLWVYEGQTEFWGRVLAARSGMRSQQETLDKLALDAALVANRSGRDWKSLADSTNDAIYMAGHSVPWRDWQRREDYYPEGVLLWLDVDARLRELSGGTRSLDDFAHRFFAADGAAQIPSTYSFEDVCAALQAIAPSDWPHFLRRHLDTHRDADAMAGLQRCGWRLFYSQAPSDTFRQDEADAGVSNLDYSIGLQVRPNGTVRSVVWNGAAFRAGLAPGAKITMINGQPFTSDALVAAIKAATTAMLDIVFEADGRTKHATISYHGTLRYPWLERIPGVPDRLTPLLATRSSSSNG